MASDRHIVDYVIGQSGLGGALGARPMFGEFALYLDGKVVALVCDNEVFLKPTAAGRALLPGAVEQAPYPGARAHLKLDEVLEDTDSLARVLRATAAALPTPRPGRRRRPG